MEATSEISDKPISFVVTGLGFWFSSSPWLSADMAATVNLCLLDRAVATLLQLQMLVLYSPLSLCAAFT